MHNEYQFQQIIKLMKISTHITSHTLIIIVLLLPIHPHNHIPHPKLLIHLMRMYLIQMQKAIYPKNVLSRHPVLEVAVLVSSFYYQTLLLPMVVMGQHFKSILAN